MPFDYTGSFSGSFAGELTSSNGVVSSSAQIDYRQIQNKPTTITAFQSNQIAANTYFREHTFVTDSSSFGDRLTTLEAQTDSDSQTLSLVGYNLSITNGNTISLASLTGAGAGGSSIWSTGSQDPLTFEYRETSNNLQVTGSLRVSGGITGSLLGTAETASYALYAVSASHEITYETSASHAEMSDTASYIDPTFISASAVEAGFGGQVPNTFPYTGSAIISGSLQVTGSLDLFYNGVGAMKVNADDGVAIVNSSTDVYGALPGSSGGHIYPKSFQPLYNRNGTNLNAGPLGNGGQQAFTFAGYNTGTSIALSTVSDGYVLFASGGLNQTWIGYGTAARDAKLWVRDYLIVEGQISASGGITGSLFGTADTASYIDPDFISASAAAAGFGDASGVGGIFAQTGSVYATTNDLEVTGSFTVTDGLLVLQEQISTPSAVEGGLYYSASALYLGVQ